MNKGYQTEYIKLVQCFMSALIFKPGLFFFSLCSQLQVQIKLLNSHLKCKLLLNCILISVSMYIYTYIIHTSFFFLIYTLTL